MNNILVAINGNLSVGKNSKLHPGEVSKRYNIVDWFGKFFDLGYKSVMITKTIFMLIA